MINLKKEKEISASGMIRGETKFWINGEKRRETLSKKILASNIY